jgi:hypothetical protein
MLKLTTKADLIDKSQQIQNMTTQQAAATTAANPSRLDTLSCSNDSTLNMEESATFPFQLPRQTRAETRNSRNSTDWNDPRYTPEFPNAQQRDSLKRTTLPQGAALESESSLPPRPNPDFPL